MSKCDRGRVRRIDMSKCDYVTCVTQSMAILEKLRSVACNSMLFLFI